jgi:hypothetical protein
MPLLFAIPIWLLVVVVGLAFLIWPRLRFLSAYFVLCSTVGLLVSFALSLLVFTAADKVKISSEIWGGLAILLIYVAMIGIGAIIGVILGFVAARKVNALFGWRQPLD